jgi:hypothetical protein
MTSCDLLCYRSTSSARRICRFQARVRRYNAAAHMLFSRITSNCYVMLYMDLLGRRPSVWLSCLCLVSCVLLHVCKHLSQPTAMPFDASSGLSSASPCPLWNQPLLCQTYKPPPPPLLLLLLLLLLHQLPPPVRTWTVLIRHEG